ncbi:hypothetical protein [Microvirga thermotolerans]|uniref:hypothetical protein n=1 Tax=Microvirga thermotolerans TaxID=2651334 RepID=UPI0018845DE9|nr:hypothetical protein [Microvirga thermotolerans]
MNWPCMAPDCAIVEDFEVLMDEEFIEESVLPGFIAGEPDVVEPDPVAAGRSVAPEDGAVEV